MKKYFNGMKILLVGDFFLDEYIYGNVERISPEAPVPIINVEKKEFNLGGAGNVCNNLINLGCNITIFGQVGKDTTGKVMLNELKKQKKVKNYLQVLSKIKTIKKTRIINKNQQIVRIDDEKIYNFTKLSKNFKNKIENEISKSSLIIVSDYGKGFCSKELCKFVINNANMKNKCVIVDPRKNFNDYDKYKNSDFITPNLNELKLLYPNIKNEDNDILKSSREIIKKYKIKNVIATRSEKGISFNNLKKSINIKTVSRQIFDVSGAGDTVVAVFSVLLLLKKDIKECLNIANKCAGIVISKKGTKPIEKKEFLKVLKIKK